MNLGTTDHVIMFTGFIVVILLVVTGTLYFNARGRQEQIETFAQVGEGLEDIPVIGESGLVAIADAEAARLMAAMEQEQLMEEKQQEELSREDVLRLNKIHTRYQQAEIEDFIEAYMHDDHMEVKDIDIRDEESFEKLILAYDYSTRRNSKYKVIERDDKLIDNGSYRYPALTFVRRKPKS